MSDRTDDVRTDDADAEALVRLTIDLDGARLTPRAAQHARRARTRRRC